MQNRLNKLFERKQNNILSIFFTAGFPHLHDTKAIIEGLNENGIDMVEIGIPFSDPMADGPTIQKSSTQAIENGITVKKILEQVAETRESVKDMPFVLMGYINPIMQYGFERFFDDAKKAGADGLIIPDLPFEDYIKNFQSLSRKYDLPIIMLITPETSEYRIHQIDSECDGFIYMVSSASTTGTKKRFNDEQLAYFHRINSMNLKHKRLIGFGISNPQTLNEAFSNSSGAIIGSLFIKYLESEPSISDAIKKLIHTLDKK